MTKYDDFGRPIYETAEEYNKARKTGATSRTYDSPEGDAYQHKTMKEINRYQSAAQRHENRTGSKKAKTMVIGLAVFFLVLNVVVILSTFGIVRGVHEDLEFDESWVDVDDEGYGEYLGDDTTPLPEGFETFSYNGQNYTLPTTVEEIGQMGFVLETEYEISDLIPSEYEELLSLNGEDGFTYAMVSVSNYTGEELPLGKCTVDYVYVENPAAFDETATTPDLVFGDRLTFESSYEELEAYFGIPYYHYEDHSEEGCFYDSYEWAYYGEEEIHFVQVTFWNGVISDVSIQKNVMDEVY